MGLSVPPIRRGRGMLEPSAGLTIDSACYCGVGFGRVRDVLKHSVIGCVSILLIKIK